MRLKELHLRNFRNYESLDLEPGTGLNVLVGKNAQGKSNLLEAIYLLATSRSLRAGRESEMVLQGAPEAQVVAEVERETTLDQALDVRVFPTDRKSLRINGVHRPRMMDLLGNLNAVFFGSLDLGIVSADPSTRRRYLNMEISQVSPRYCFDLASYKKALEQRNRLLKEMKENPYRDHGILEAWNEQLIQYGATLFHKRLEYVAQLTPLAETVHRELTDGKEQLCLRYLPNVAIPVEADLGTIESAFRAEMARVADYEVRRGTTLVGPQRDDLQFLINGLDARTFGSQGQQRTVVLSIKLAEFRWMQESIGEAPIVLLDDVMSDLDDARRKHLLEWTRRHSQTFITCTNVRSFPDDILLEAKVYHVSAGILSVPDPTSGLGRRGKKSLEIGNQDTDSDIARVEQEFAPIASEN